MTFRDGEMLPMIGGPKDGQKAPVIVVWGSVLSPIEIDGEPYRLDRDKRAWVYIGKATVKTCQG